MYNCALTQHLTSQSFAPWMAVDVNQVPLMFSICYMLDILQHLQLLLT